MKTSFSKFALIITILLTFVGCTTNNPQNIDLHTKVTVKASYDKPASYDHEDTLIIDGILEGEEYIEILIDGVIYDFEHVSLVWQDNDIKENEVLNSFDKLENQTLIIKTYQPEGIPSEKIKWKSDNGDSYEYIIQESSLGPEDNSIIIFDLKKAP